MFIRIQLHFNKFQVFFLIFPYFHFFGAGLVRLPNEAEHGGLPLRDGHRSVGRRLSPSGADRHEAIRKHVHRRRQDEGDQGVRIVRHSVGRKFGDEK